MSLLTKTTVLSLCLCLLTACGSDGNGSVSSTTANLSMTLDLKTFRFSWTDVNGATFYRVLENPNGSSGFTQVGPDIATGVETYDHVVPLYARINASYILQSCNNAGCTDSSQLAVSTTLVDAIGYFKASNTGASDSFGFSVSLSGDGNTLAVGAPYEDSNTTGINTTPNDDGTANGSGAAYIFTRNASNWSEQAYIKASNSGAFDRFGISVGLSNDGNTLAVGAAYEDSNTTGINTIPNDDGTADSSGAAYVFTRSASNWSEQAYIKPSNTGAGDNFGFSVSLSGDGNT
ncbi:MAG: FG-GAP repeat protein, partial [Gammaproteobacteria bacterium]|nr:FG-GAP repeat protein [Gammaproteobacteria bacterium]